MTFNYDNLSKNSLPYIDSSLKKLSDASNTLYSSKVPSDFDNLNLLNNISGRINNYINDLTKIKSKISNDNNNYNKILNDYNLDISNIQIIKYKK